MVTYICMYNVGLMQTDDTMCLIRLFDISEVKQQSRLVCLCFHREATFIYQPPDASPSLPLASVQALPHPASPTMQERSQAVRRGCTVLIEEKDFHH